MSYRARKKYNAQSAGQDNQTLALISSVLHRHTNQYNIVRELRWKNSTDFFIQM